MLFNKMKEKIKELIIKIQTKINNKKEKIKNKVLYYFPLNQYFPFRQLIKINNNRIQYLQHEKKVFIEKMPNWYNFLLYNKYMFKLRYIAPLWFILQGDAHQNMIGHLLKKFLHLNDIFIIQQIFFCITFLFIFYLVFILTINFILRFVFIEDLLYNSPFNYKKAINWTASQTGAVIAGVGLLFGVGTSQLDTNLKELGYKPLNQGKISYGWYYNTEDITEKMASKPYHDYKYFDEKAIGGIGKYLKKIQEHDQSYYDELANVYENRQKKEELLKLKQDTQYKKEN